MKFRINRFFAYLWLTGRGQRLEIDYAMYGQIMNQVNVCTASSTGEMAQFNAKCTMPNTLIWLKERCHGKTSCSASLADLKLASPCPRTAMQLQYRYRCVSQASTCRAGQFFLDGGCYEIFGKARATWDEARMYCGLYGGELPAVLSLDAETVVTQALNKELQAGSLEALQVCIAGNHCQFVS